MGGMGVSGGRAGWKEKHYIFMYFKGIIKNNETNFLACRIIGFVALIFLSFSSLILLARALYIHTPLM